MAKVQKNIIDSKKSVYEEDFDKLLKLGNDLQSSFIKYCDINTNSKIKQEEWQKFFINYQHWYSESISLIRVIFPDRLDEFKKLYEKQSKRKDISLDNYVIEDALNGISLTRYGTTICQPSNALLKFQRQLAILYSLKKVFISSLFSLKTLLQADLFDNDIEAAETLNKNGYYRAAGAMCGVVIEQHLKDVCNNHNLKIIKANPGINDLNELLKSNNVYQISIFRKIQYLADIRNKCDHKKQEEPAKEEIKELINGTSWLIKNIF